MSVFFERGEVVECIMDYDTWNRRQNLQKGELYVVMQFYPSSESVKLSGRVLKYRADRFISIVKP